ncbi:MAG TPA: carbohydrate-binding protein [Kiloniellales bacterium]
MAAEIETIRSRLDALEAGAPPPPVPEPEPEPEPEECLVSQVELGQSPFPGSLNLLPGRIEAEDFDLGGEGVAYHDLTPGNAWHFYRDDVDVDIKPTGDPEGGQFQLGLNKAGEWVEYTVCVRSGIYDVRLRALCGIAEANGGCGTIAVSLGGPGGFVPLGSIKVPFTGSWDTDAVTLVIPNVTVAGGNKILRLDFSGNYLDLNWLQFVTAGTANRAPTDLMLCPARADGQGEIRADTSDPAMCDQGSG